MSVQNSYLLKYTKTPPKGKQECPLCKKVFSLPAVLSKHLKTQHDIKDLPLPKKTSKIAEGPKRSIRIKNGKEGQSQGRSSSKVNVKNIKNEPQHQKSSIDKDKDELTDETPRRRGRPRKNVVSPDQKGLAVKGKEKNLAIYNQKTTLTSPKTLNKSKTGKTALEIRRATIGSKRVHQSDTESDSQTEGKGRPKRNRREKRAWSPSNDNSIILETTIKQEPIDDEYRVEPNNKVDAKSSTETSYSCDICSRTFSTYAGLSRHIRIHTDEDVGTEITRKPPQKNIVDGSGKSLQKQRLAKTHVKSEFDHKAVNKSPQKIKQPQNIRTDTDSSKSKKLQKVNDDGVVSSIENSLKTSEKSGEVHVVVNNMTRETEEAIKELVESVMSVGENQESTENVDTVVITNDKDKVDDENDDDNEYMDELDDDKDEDYRPSKDDYGDENDMKDIKPSIKKHKRGRRSLGRTYPCKSCDKVFTKPSHLLRHNTKHTGERPFPCDVCGKGFVSKSNMEKHRVLHSGVKSKICDECGKAFALSSYLVRHKLLHEKERNEKLGIKPPLEHHLCFECGKVFSKALYLQKHMERHVKGKCYECRICGKKFSQRMNRINHEFLHNKTKDLECNICHKKFALKCYLKIHMQRHQKSAEGKVERKPRPNLGQKPFECSQCGKCYSSAKYLSSHEKRHENPKKFVCETCGRNFQQKINLQRHMLTHTDPATSKNYECKECGKKYSRDIYLDRHVKENHTPEGLAKPRHCCQYCDKTFMKPCLLRIHERTHTKEKPFVCSTCGKGFAQEGYMRIHEEIHSSYKKHECQFCGKSFALLYYLTRHLARHEQVKSIPCDQCTKMFASQKALEDHKRIHSGDLPFKCETCQRSFPRLNSLQRHKKMNACQNVHKGTITVGTYRYIAAGTNSTEPVTYTEETLDNFMDRKEFSCLYICSICRQVFTSQAKLDAHAVEHAGEEVTMETVQTVVQEEPIAAEAIPVTKEEETIIAEVVNVEDNLLQVGGEEVTTLTTEETVVDSDWLNKLFSNAHVESGTDGKIIIVVNRE